MDGSDPALRRIPSVDRLADQAGDRGLPRPLRVALARQAAQEARRQDEPPRPEGILEAYRDRVEQLAALRLQPVVNATGIVLHTNLGRAPLSSRALDRLRLAAEGYANLEFDLIGGRRGRRGIYAERCLSVLVGAADSLVVNNCAAALLLVLHHAAARARPEAIVSRGDMVQIGGGFRIPDILEASGAEVREVGTANRTGLEDYRKAVTSRTGVILRVHRSNFRMEGFVSTPALEELAALGRNAGVPLVYDQGCGAMDDSGPDDEIPPVKALAQGASLVCFSGDKLFGGPQAGLICGRAEAVGALRRLPVSRALRPGKLELAALEATLEERLEGGATLPVEQCLSRSVEELRERAQRIAARAPAVPVLVESSQAETGGGTRPALPLPSVALRLELSDPSPKELARRFRHADPPVIGYATGNRFHLDLRTVLPSQDGDLVRILGEIL